MRSTFRACRSFSPVLFFARGSPEADLRVWLRSRPELDGSAQCRWLGVGAEAIRLCRFRGLTVFDTIEEVPKHAWDIVFCRHVLEHVEQPLPALITMRKLIVPTGEVYLVLPKEDHFRLHIAPDEDQHIFCWNFRAINNLLFRVGLVPYLNDYRYVLGWHRLLPVRRWLGPEAYYQITKFGGIFRRNGELIVRARLPQ